MRQSAPAISRNAFFISMIVLVSLKNGEERRTRLRWRFKDGLVISRWLGIPEGNHPRRDLHFEKRLTNYMEIFTPPCPLARHIIKQKGVLEKASDEPHRPEAD